MSMREHKQNYSSKTNSWGAGNKHQFLIPLLFLCMLTLAASAFAEHDNNASLSPEWSPANQNVAYEVELCNVPDGGDSIDEVRIYRADDYTDFVANSKTGWYLSPLNPVKNYYQFTANNSGYYIEEGKCDTFTFSATTPGSGCEWEWKFETRDVTQTWKEVFDTTSVDDLAPIVIKDVIGPQSGPCPPGAGEECWVTQSTDINVTVVEQGDCGISGLDYCKITYTVDGAGPYTEVDDDLDGEHYWEYIMNFNEDSVHILTVECEDIAGNKVTDTETFRVDDEEPDTTKVISEPKKIVGNVEWVDTKTVITLTSVDPEAETTPQGVDCSIGVKKIYWANTIVDDIHCWEPENPDYCNPVETQMTEVEGNEVIIRKERESCHLLQYYAVDELGNEEKIQTNCFFVDKTPPMVIKDNGQGILDRGEPFFMTPENPEGAFHWITTSMPVTFTCDDSHLGDAPHPSGDEELCFKVSYDYPDWGYVTERYCSEVGGAMNAEGYCCVSATPKDPFRFYFLEESMHDLEYYCEDAVEKKTEPHVQYYKVDDTPPSIEKKMIGDDHLGDCPPEYSPDGETHVCYVRDDGVNGVRVDVTDGGDVCAVDMTSCTYMLLWKGEPIASNIPFGEEGVDIIFTKDSTHTLIINCEDALGNKMKEDVEVFLVDSTPPVTTKVYGEPHYPENINDPAPYPHWITTQTLITLTAEDEKVGVDKIFWRNLLVDERYCMTEYSGCQNADVPEGGWQEYTGVFTKPEESCHLIEFYSVDKLGNTETVNRQCVFVDDTEPTVEKIVGDNKVACDPSDPLGCDYYITKQTPITLTCTDQTPHPVDHVKLEFRYRTSDDCATWGDWTLWEEAIEPVITFPEDSCHELEYKCEDILGNATGVYIEIDIVDTVPPVITKTVSDPKIDCPPEELYDPSGAPIDCFQIDGITEIRIDATDPDPHPVDEVTCDWDYQVLDGPKLGTGASGVVPPFVIIFPEESRHILTVTCTDALGNEVIDVEKFIVDHTPPETTKTYTGPQYPLDGGYPKWINSSTTVHLEATDDIGPHDSGVKATYWRNEIVPNEHCEDPETYCKPMHTPEGGGWNLYTEPFQKKEESCHMIEYYSVDNVDKVEPVKAQCVYVDNNPPTPIKIVGEPKDEWTPGENGDPESYFYPEETKRCWNNEADELECWEVTTLTPINMDCVDEGDHPVDHETVCFNVELDGEDTTADYCPSSELMKYSEINDREFCCLDYEMEEFRFKEDSEHNLKYYCVDALGNTNEADVDEEKFKVEGTKFEIPLYKKWNLISVPFQLLSDAPEDVFTEDKGIKGVDSVWTYDPTNDLCPEGWCVYTPDGVDNDNLHNITPGWGYWVMELLDEEWLTIGGSLFKTGPVAPPTRDLEPGWNLVGYYGSSWEIYDWGDFDFVCGDAFDFPDKYVYGDKVYCALNSLVDTQEGYPRWSSLWSYINCGDHKDAWLGLNACADESIQACMDRMYAGRGYWVEMDVADGYAPATTCIWNDDFECRWTGGGIIP